MKKMEFKVHSAYAPAGEIRGDYAADQRSAGGRKIQTLLRKLVRVRHLRLPRLLNRCKDLPSSLHIIKPWSHSFTANSSSFSPTMPWVILFLTMTIISRKPICRSAILILKKIFLLTKNSTNCACRLPPNC